MERGQTESERAYLEKRLSNLPTGRRRVKEAVENFFVTFTALTLLGVLAWGGLAWLTGKLADVEVGWTSDYAIPVVLFLLAASALYGIYSTASWMRSWPDHRQAVRDDLNAGLVTEERLTVLEAKVLQEPEHGGLIYLLRSGDGRVFVLYDHESLDLAMNDEDPMGSRFDPQSIVTIVRAPQSGFMIESSFSGDDIDIQGPIEMTATPGKWPQDEKFFSLAWEQIETELCA